MTLRASKDDRLLGASTAVAQRVEVHSMVEQDGRMQMRPLQSLQLPRGKAVELSPTGTHLMLIGLRESLRAEKHFEITLRFEQAGEQTVKVHVKSPADVSKSHEGHPSHH